MNTLEDLKAAIDSFVVEREWGQFHSPKNLSMALSVEASELTEHFLWLTQEESRNLNPYKLAEVEEEVGDVLIYLLRMSQVLGIDPLKAAHTKLEWNKVKYPVWLVRGKANKYTEYPPF